MADSSTRNLNDMTVPQLRQALQSVGISPPSRTLKNNLIALYQRHLASRAPTNQAAVGVGPTTTPSTRSRRPSTRAAQVPAAPPAPTTTQRRPRGRPATAQPAPTTPRTQASQAATPRTRVRYGEPGYAGMTRPQLQDELRRRGLPSSGTRDVLMQRLAGPVSAGAPAEVPPAPPVTTTRRRGRPARAATTVVPETPTIPAPAAAAVPPAAPTTARRRGRPPSAMAAPSPAARSPAASTIVPTVVPTRGEIPLVPLSLPPPPTPIPSVVAPAVGSPRTSSSATVATTGFPTSPRLSTSTVSPRLSASASTLPTTTTTTESGTSLSPRLLTRAPGTLSPLRGGQGPTAGQGTANGRYRM